MTGEVKLRGEDQQEDVTDGDCDDGGGTAWEFSHSLLHEI
jgi:hypothetical protein